MIGQRIGKYRLIRTLGQGGMGVVYEAVREDIEVRAAIKVLRPEYASNAEVAGRFFNEARAANLIAHPGIVKVFDYGHDPGGVAYLAMEYLEGESLYKRLTRIGKMAHGDVLRLGRQLASALAAAHDKGIVHRDLKPDKVMLERQLRPIVPRRDEVLASHGLGCTRQSAIPPLAAWGAVGGGYQDCRRNC